MKHMFAACAAALLLAGATYHAAAQHAGHTGHTAPAATAKADTASTKAYQAANDRMHKDMTITFSGDADVDFVKGMVPHHQGAVDMAKIVLQYGADPELKALARDIVNAQEKEIAFMTAWLAKKGKS